MYQKFSINIRYSIKIQGLNPIASKPILSLLQYDWSNKRFATKTVFM